MDKLKLVWPTTKHIEQLEALRASGIDSSAGAGRLEELGAKEWIKKSDDHRQGKNLPEGFVPATQFLAIKDKKIVGLLQIRGVSQKRCQIKSTMLT